MNKNISPIAKLHMAKTIHYESSTLENEQETHFSGDIIDVIDNIIIKNDYNYGTKQQSEDVSNYMKEADTYPLFQSKMTTDLDVYLGNYKGQQDGIYFRARDLLKENTKCTNQPYKNTKN